MNNTIKISLTIYLEGSTLVRKSEPETIKYTVTERDLNPSKKWKGNDGLKVIRRGTSKHYSLITKSASQHINMTEEAYNYMTSKECPEFSRPAKWKSMSVKERLEAHLSRICMHLGGKYFEYTILEK